MKTKKKKLGGYVRIKKINESITLESQEFYFNTEFKNN